MSRFFHISESSASHLADVVGSFVTAHVIPLVVSCLEHRYCYFCFVFVIVIVIVIDIGVGTGIGIGKASLNVFGAFLQS